MDLQLEGKVALVLGAGGGLGSAIARSLAEEGVHLGLADIDADALARTQSRLGAHVKSAAVPWDLSELDAISQRLRTVVTELGPVDILVNLTGGPKPTPVSGQPLDSWQGYFRSMVLSIVATTDLVLPSMRERGWGRVITSTSSGVIAPIPHLGVSNALRASLLGWSKTLAREVAADGVTSNVVVPGRIATARIEALDHAKATREGRTVQEVAADSVAAIPVGRYGEPQEYADAVTFLASPRAGYITGSVIRVDGGLVASI